MTESNNMKNTRTVPGFLIGLIAGGVAGGTIALLYAPKSGKELRNDISRQKDRLIDDANDYIATAKDKAANILNESKSKAESIITDAKDKAQGIIEGAGKMYGTGKDKIISETAKVKDAINAGVEAYRDERINSK